MAIAVQILGLRPYTHKGKIAKREVFFEKGWQAQAVPELFVRIDEYLSIIPSDEHYNLYYTAAKCEDRPGRIFVEQEVIPFDLDGIDVTRFQDYIPVVCAELGVPSEQMGIVFSGNGLQFIVGLVRPITDANFFVTNRANYKAVCTRINERLNALGLCGTMDASVFSPGRLLRLPNTKNIKTPEQGFPNKNSETKAVMVNAIIAPTAFSLGQYEDTPQVSKVSKDIKRFSTPDPEYMLEECLFLRYCMETPDAVTEQQWYAALSLTAHASNKLGDSELSLAHRISAGYKNYDQHETHTKAQHALTASGPYKCDTICGFFDQCVSCPHWGICVSPISLHGPDHIRTKESGFRRINVKGQLGGPEYNDLIKYFNQLHDIIVTTGDDVYQWVGTHWEEMPNSELEFFAEEHLWDCMNQHCTEFVKKLKRGHKRVKETFFYDTTFNRMNLRNGVLDFTGGEPKLLAHGPEYGFAYTLDYDYDPDAQCPTFDKFLYDIMCGDDQLQMTLLEYASNAFFNLPSKQFAKCLIQIGEGANGKSTFTDLLMSMLNGSNTSKISPACCSISLSRLTDPKHISKAKHASLAVADEAVGHSLANNDTFKTMISGGNVSYKLLYKDETMAPFNAKIIINSNHMPMTSDFSHGFMRRLLIVPFEARFGVDSELGIDRRIDEKLVKEKSGILNRIIKAHKSLLERDGFDEHRGKLLFQRNDYIDSQDVVKMFLDEKVTKSLNGQVKSTTLYTLFRTFCEENGHKNIIHNTQFFIRLKRYYAGLEKVRGRDSGTRFNFYRGIKLLDDCVDDEVEF
jgi:putative DNA primase/helicase